MTNLVDVELAGKIKTALVATIDARKAGDEPAADRHWREYVGLIELSMGRVNSSARLTPNPTLVEKLP